MLGAPGIELRADEDIGNGINGATGHLTCGTGRYHLGRRFSGGKGGHHAIDQGAVAHPVGGGGVALCLIGPVKHFGSHALPDLIGGARDGDPTAVLGREMSVRADVVGAQPFPLPNSAIFGVGRGQFIQYPEYTFEQGLIDDLALAGAFHRAQRH